MKHAISRRWSPNPGQGRSHYPHKFWSSYKCLLHYQSEGTCVHSIVIEVRPLTIEHRTVIIFWAHSPIPLWYPVQSHTWCLFGIHSWILIHLPLKYRCPHKKSNRIRAASLRMRLRRTLRQNGRKQTALYPKALNSYMFWGSFTWSLGRHVCYFSLCTHFS